MPPPQNFAFGGAVDAVNTAVSDQFDPTYYLGRYRDVASSSFGSNPLSHYTQYGRGEQRYANAAQEAAANQARRNEIGAEAFRKEVMGDPKRYGNTTYAQEFAGSFVAGDRPQAPQTPQPTRVASPAYTSQGKVFMAEGGLASIPQTSATFSQGVANAGRNGDSMLAHLTPEQHQI